jgi:tetratricopeptide (TPR) repeat protein
VINQQVTVVNYRPPPVALPAPFVVDDLTLAILPRPEPELPLNPRPLPQRNKPGAGTFRPGEAKDREKKPAQPEPAPPPRPEAPKPPPAKPPDVPRMPHPNPEPRGEYARLIELGKESFADTDYGLAAQRFRQASEVLPNEGQARFLLAHALLAFGKYQDAVDAINAGISLEPNWPASNFHPLDLYGQHVALYPEHLQRLEDAVGRNPNDAVVLFLYGYELWFDGRKDEARGLFQKALTAGADAIVIDRFFRALPPGEGV